jgi:hypothetical protein
MFLQSYETEIAAFIKARVSPIARPLAPHQHTRRAAPSIAPHCGCGRTSGSGASGKVSPRVDTRHRCLKPEDRVGSSSVTPATGK